MKAKEYLEKYFPVSECASEEVDSKQHFERIEKCFKAFWDETALEFNKFKTQEAQIRKFHEHNKKWCAFVDIYMAAYGQKREQKYTKESTETFQQQMKKCLLTEFNKQVKMDIKPEIKAVNRKSDFRKETDLKHSFNNNDIGKAFMSMMYFLINESKND